MPNGSVRDRSDSNLRADRGSNRGNDKRIVFKRNKGRRIVLQDVERGRHWERMLRT
jgi:hypothetical protein